MYSYIVGIILLIFQTFFMYTLGSAILKNKKNASHRFVVGFLYYSFFIAIFGIIIQLLKMKYMYFFILFILIYIISIFFIIYRYQKYNLKLFPKKIKIFIKENIFVLILSILLIAISLTYINYYWEANFLDDGYYLVKAATMSISENPFELEPATGLKISNLFTYALNTWELEASTYIKILNIDPSIYLRFVLALFNYFLLINVIVAFSKEVFKDKINKYIYQFIPCILLLFSFSSYFLASNHIINAQDIWHFNSAMYYGSSIVKTMSIFIILLPLINIKKIDLNIILKLIMISVVLVSKSTVAIPIIFTTNISF